MTPPTPPKPAIKPVAHPALVQPLKGVDVFHGDGAIQWHAVAAAGIKFGFCKATEGVHTDDPAFATNWAGMKAVGIIRGAYHFYLPGEDAIAQAKHFCSIAKPGKGDFPLALDVETAGPDLVAGVKTCLETIKRLTGVRPILYTYLSFIKDNPHLMDLVHAGYPLWVAEYGVATPKAPVGKGYLIWQRSDAGTVPGIVNHAVDVDQFDGTLDQLLAHTIGGALCK